ncbi:hypothetical protein CAPTEDRAFT_211128 [Capitella teleta]|uniref:SCP domain-containing protein n=1 Tax=Capitella teleta TaxID=283909 RepID=R7TU10_CAPTE|nr:hypothetical protein CAPTEDRAFT_211128 [Capitella teleta]|eukprot:ELT94505.1 hypothetical protein CAPTEDRAFT_211128 [Capitella teleta]
MGLQQAVICVLLAMVVLADQDMTSHKVTTEQDMVLMESGNDVFVSALDGVAAHKQIFPKPESFSPIEMQTILDLHNFLRSKEMASNMNFITWNQYLAEMAFEWSTQCYFEHGQPQRDHVTLPYVHIGQAMMATTRRFNPLLLIEKWHAERRNFDPLTFECNGDDQCANYLQLVWAETKEVGCAYSSCPKVRRTNLTNAFFMVCNYGPPGNLRTREAFRRGPPCTQCESGRGWCKDGLCVDTCQHFSSGCTCESTCYNCGLIDWEKCLCNCPSGWLGPDCSAKCEERSIHCHSTPGWPASWCYLKYVWLNCPVMCGRCTPGDGEVNCDSRLTSPEEIEAWPSTSGDVTRGLSTMAAILGSIVVLLM